jgi:hypothetical protein
MMPKHTVFTLDTPLVTSDRPLTLPTNDCESNTPEFDYVPLTPNTSAVNIEFKTDVNNDIFTELKEVRKRHPNQFSCAYLNINSFGYKFCSVQELLTTNTVDMLIIAETKSVLNSIFTADVLGVKGT